jgi:zinc/manganese transport system substrate-binding protein
MKRLFLTLILLLASMAASAEVRVVATVPNMGMLAETVGGNAVHVTVLAPPDRDAHYLEARPSMMAALRRADLVVAVGAELEVGWLPAALQGAHNPNIQVGRQGYFEGAAQIDLIQVGLAADRAHGDVHPAGNPHYYFDPLRMGEVAKALAERLADFAPDHAEQFRSNAREFAEQAAEHVERWQARAEGAPGVVFYHKDVDYLAKLMDVEILGYIEPLPGIPPTARHLSELVGSLRGNEGVILYADFQPSRGPEFVARELGWSQQQLPNQVDIGADSQAYFDLINRWVEAFKP